MSKHALSVFDSDARVGTIGYESLEEQFSFQYADEWRSRAGSYSISPHIRLTGPPPPSGTVRRFVENLLPEGRALDIVSTTLKVARNNLYGLIREIGQETSGALSFRGAGGSQVQPTTRREVYESELVQRIDERARVPFAVWDGRVRMSMAGYQDKLAVYLDSNNRSYLVEGDLASTHILKPEPTDTRLPMLVANEHFSMSLARRLGLSVAPVSILRVPDPLLVIERFDRVRDTPDRVRRLHTIDSCQALDLPVSYKYERNFGSGRDVRNIRDGVSFRRLFSIADYATEKAVVRLGLLRWAILQYLIGNSDAHGKNVSFFCHPSGLSLTPCYDLVSVVQYEGIDHEMAMALGDEFDFGQVRPYDWAEFSVHSGIPRNLLVREMRRLGAAARDAAAEQAAEPAYEDQERPFVSRIAEFVIGQANKLVNMADAVRAVELD
ncbi:MAG: HipA domain-containing protein [Candidatus Binataceae bacterium]